MKNIGIYRFCFLCALLSMSVEILSAQPNFWVPKELPMATYQIDARVDIDEDLISGTQTLVFINHTNRLIESFALDWAISEYRSIKVQQGDNMFLPLNPTNESLLTAPLFFVLPEPIPPGGTFDITISFTIHRVLENNRNRIRTTGWYPKVWWDGLPTHDQYRVRIEAPQEYTMALSGRLNADTGYHEATSIKRFGLFLEKNILTKTALVRGIEIRVLHREAGEQTAQVILNTAIDAMQFYIQHWGFYPFRFLNILPGANRPVGGYPFASGSVVIHGMEKFSEKPLLHWQWITAHEIGHQYWGEYVMDGDNPAWLWIGLGIHTDRAYMKASGLGLEKHLGMMGRFISALQQNFDTTVDISLKELSRLDSNQYNNSIKHGKGYSIISALDMLLGEDRFKALLYRILQDYGGRRLGYREFQALCEEETGERLNWFFDQWVGSNAYPHYVVSKIERRKEKEKHISVVIVTQKGTLDMPVPVQAVFEDGSSQIKFTNRYLVANHLQFESETPLNKAIIDPQHKLAMPKEPLLPTSESVIEEVNALPYTRLEVDPRPIFANLVQLDIDNSGAWYKMGLVLFDSENYKEAFQAFMKVWDLNTSSRPRYVILTWLGQLKDLMGERQQAKDFYRQAQDVFDGRNWTYDQYGIRMNSEWLKARLEMPYKR